MIMVTQHVCRRPHRDYPAAAKCQWAPGWVFGNGQYAVIACGVVGLYATETEARRHFGIVTTYGCSHDCDPATHRLRKLVTDTSTWDASPPTAVTAAPSTG